MSGYELIHVDEIEEVDDGRCPMRPVRHHFGISSFGINAWTGHATGDRIINEHAEDDPGGEQEEVYLVLSGRAVFELDGERRDAPAGTFVFVEPGVKRTAFADEPETTIVVVGAVRGQAYEVSGWELWAPVRPLYASGAYAEAADKAAELAAAHPEYPALAYNAACCEGLAGRAADALEHLRQAIQASEQFRSFARVDSDLDSLRGEPAFAELVGD